MVSYFSAHLQYRIQGATPLLHRIFVEQWDWEEEFPQARFERDEEIAHWKAMVGSGWMRWAALDDQAHLFAPFDDRIVICDGKVGLTQGGLDRVGAIYAAR